MLTVVSFTAVPLCTWLVQRSFHWNTNFLGIYGAMTTAFTQYNWLTEETNTCSNYVTWFIPKSTRRKVELWQVYCLHWHFVQKIDYLSFHHSFVCTWHTITWASHDVIIWRRRNNGWAESLPMSTRLLVHVECAIVATKIFVHLFNWAEISGNKIERERALVNTKWWTVEFIIIWSLNECCAFKSSVLEVIRLIPLHR